MKINQSKSSQNFDHNRSNPTRKNHLTLLIMLPLVTVFGGYFLAREIRLNAAQKLIHDCIENQKNCADNLSLVEKLVKAHKSLKLFNLENANLKSANLENANLKSANLENANLKNAHLENAHLENANLSIAHLENAHLENAHLENANLSNIHLEGANLSGANLSGAYISHDHLDSAYLIEANLQGLHLYYANFNQAYFYLANLSYTYFYRANFHHANLYRANLHHAYLIEAQNLTPTQIKSACNWETAIYKGNFDQDQGRWIVDEAANENYIKELKQDRDSDTNEAIDCNKWK